MPTALLADDDDRLRARLRQLLAAAWPELLVVSEGDAGPSAIAALAGLQPDLAFVGIRQQSARGLDLARAAGGRCHVVFTTAYDSDVIEAFEAAAVDYLLEPILADPLQHAVTRLHDRLASAQPAVMLDSRLERLADTLRQRAARSQGGPERLRSISASVGGMIKVFDIDDVLFFQSDHHDTRLVTASGEALVRKPLLEIAEGLDPDAFWQVQRGVIVRGSAVSRAQRDEQGRITLHLEQHADKLPVSQAFAWRFEPM